jgi:hypothetical protein
MSFEYYLCGLRVVSALPLPDWLPWTDAAGAADVEIVLGSVPDLLPDATYVGPFLQIVESHDARVEISAVATYRIERGLRITIAPKPGGECGAIALFLLQTAFAILWLQRRQYTMRASVVEINGRAVALTGISGIGKSTLGAALIKLGHRLLSDDIAVIDTTAARFPFVLPTIPIQRLWLDSFVALGIVPGARIRNDPSMHKFSYHVTDRFQPQPLPLEGICFLDRMVRTQPAIERLSGAAGIHAIRGQALRLHAAQAMGLEPNLFLQAAHIAASVPQVVLRRPMTFNNLIRFANDLPDLLESARLWSTS